MPGRQPHAPRLLRRATTSTSTASATGARTRATSSTSRPIEVLKGPSSTMFGRGSTGGVINQVSKTPDADAVLRLLGDHRQRAAAGPDHHRRQPAVLPTRSPLRFNAMFYDGDVAGRDEVEFQRWGMAPVGDARARRARPSLTLSYFYQHENNIPDNGLPYLFGSRRRWIADTFYGLPDNDFEHDGPSTSARCGSTTRSTTTSSSATRCATRDYRRDQESTAPRIAGTPTPSTPAREHPREPGHRRPRSRRLHPRQPDRRHRQVRHVGPASTR